MRLNYFLIISAALQSFLFVRGEFKLQIMHTNDMHARFNEIDEFTAACSTADANHNKCYGGFARIRRTADRMREEASSKNISSIFLNAGDTFQGTPYYSVYKWKIAAALINTLGLDAMCLGNHEFDDGVHNLVQYLEHANVSTVTANLNRSTEARLNETLVKNSIVLDVKGHKLGIIGYLTPDTMMLSSTENLQIFDEIPYLRQEAKNLKSKGVNFIIGLGHSGFDRDKKIAAEVEELDVIVGGHSHSLLYNPKDNQPSRERVVESYPYWVTQKSGKRVPIVQSFALTKYFGSLTLTLDDKYKIISAEGNSHLLNYTYQKDQTVEKEVDKWTAALRKKLSTVVGQTRVMLTRSKFFKNDFESNLVNVITDAIFHQGVLQAKANNRGEWTEHAVAFYQNGGIRAEFGSKRDDGNLTLEDIFTALPFQNTLYQCRLFGKEIRQLLELSVIEFQPTTRYVHYFMHFSGLRVIYDLRRPPTERVTDVMVLCTRCSVPRYEPLKTNERYYVILNSFLAQGGDNFIVFKQSCTDLKSLEIKDADAVVHYIQKEQIIYPRLDGRIEVLEEDGKPSTATRNFGLLDNLLFVVVVVICVLAVS